MKISIIIACYNEDKTIKKIINKINNLKDLNKEIIVIDDNSTDNSRKILKEELSNSIDSLILNDKNYGKGYCIREGIKVAKGDVIIIQDADLEYDPSDYIKLISPIKNDIADVVCTDQDLLGLMKREFYFIGTQWVTLF
jgi:glycosyltransferase involved in cell wall biosynthesis